jgi:hypothetical protein
MAALAVGLPSHVVRAVAHKVERVGRLRIPAEIAEHVVALVSVVVAALHAFGAGADECEEDKAMNGMSRRPSVALEADLQVALLASPEF